MDPHLPDSGSEDEQPITEKFSSPSQTRNDSYIANIAYLAAKSCNTSIAFITAKEGPNQILKGFGLNNSNRSFIKAVCERLLPQTSTFVIEDIYNNHLLDGLIHPSNGMDIRFFAGTPFKNPENQTAGYLCLMGNKSAKLNSLQIQLLETLAEAIANKVQHIQNEDQIDPSKSEFEKIFDLSPDLLCMANKEGYFTKVNEAFTSCLGYTSEELIGVPFMNFVHESDKTATLEAFNTLILENKKVILFSNRYCKKDGGFVHLVWNAKPDPVTGVIIANARDVSEIDKLNEQIEKARSLEQEMNKERIRQLLSLSERVSHELMNPANMIMGFTEMIRELVDDLSDNYHEDNKKDILDLIRTDLEKISSHSRYISQIIQRMDMEINYTAVPSIISNL